METYKSNKVVIDHNIELIYSKLSNPSMFKEKLEKNRARLEALSARIQELKESK